MRPIQFTVSRAAKIRNAPYEARDAFASITVELDPGDDLEEAYSFAWSTVQRQIHKQQEIILQGDEKMPIHELKDGAMFPMIGHIRKGAPKGDNKPGKDLDYFRVEFDTEDADLIKESFIDIYGNEPREIRIMLISDDIDRVFDAWRETYVSGGLTHRCDGHIVHYPSEDRGKPCALKDDPDKRKRCKPTGRLRVLVPELGRAGMLTVHTTSWNDIREIYANLEAVLSLAGRLQGIPLILRRVEREVSFTDDSGNRKKYKKWLLHIEISPKWVERRMLAIQQASLLQASNVPMLVSGHDYEDDDDYVVNIETGEIVGEDEQQALHWSLQPHPRNGSMTNGDVLAAKFDFDICEALNVFNLTEYDGTAAEAYEELMTYVPALDTNTILAVINDACANDTGESITDKQKGLLAMKLNELVGDAKRHELMHHVFGVSSCFELTKKQASVLIDWSLSDGAKEQAEIIMRDGALQQGQVDMFGAEEAKAKLAPEGQTRL